MKPKIRISAFIKENWMIFIGGSFFIIFLLVAICGYFLTYGQHPLFDPSQVRLQEKLLPPFSHADTAILTKDQIPPFSIYILGTDHLGRDVFARMLQGAWISLTVGFVSVGISIIVGIVLGAISGYYGDKKIYITTLVKMIFILLFFILLWKKLILFAICICFIFFLFIVISRKKNFMLLKTGLSVDSFIMRFVDIMLCFPSFFLILTVVALLPPSIFNIMVVIGLTSWMGTARLVRAEFLSLREQEFVIGAKALGLRDFLIIFKHILPNALTPVMVSATIGIAIAILTEAGLSFLGFGVPPPQATWGNILSEGKNYLFDAPWLTIIPGLAILIVVLAFNLMGEGIRMWLNPKRKNF